MDNKLKMIFWGFSPVDYIAMEKKLNSHSQEGWHLSSLSQYKGMFYFDDSQKIDYRVLPSEVKLNNQSLKRFSESDAANKMLLEGWQIVDGYGHILVFAKKREINEQLELSNSKERFASMKQFAIAPAITNDFIYSFLIIAMSFFSPTIGNFQNTQWIILGLGLLPLLTGVSNLLGSKKLEKESMKDTYKTVNGTWVRRVLTGLSYPIICFIIWLMIIVSVSGNEGVSLVMTIIGLIVLFFVMYFMGRKATKIKYKM